eukprot:6464690-Amphidinium_carterae.1
MTLVQSLRGLSRAEFRATHGYLGQDCIMHEQVPCAKVCDQLIVVLNFTYLVPLLVPTPSTKGPWCSTLNINQKSEMHIFGRFPKLQLADGIGKEVVM